MGILGIGIVLLGVAGVMSRVGMGWGFTVLLLGLPALGMAFTPSPKAAPIPFAVGVALVVLGEVAMTMGKPVWFGLLGALLGVASLVWGGITELPHGRRGQWEEKVPP